MWKKLGILICFYLSLLWGGVKTSSLLDKRINEVEPYTFIPVWVFWNSEKVAADIFNIELLGGRMRTNSSYLQASSFYVPAGMVEIIESIENVKGLDLVRRGKVEGGEITVRGNLKEYYGRDLNYGLSESQLEALNIPKVHNEGYMGSGVKIAVFDTGFDSTHITINHIWQRGGVVATHDFNSGDRIESDRGAPPLPYSGVRYINSYSVTSDGDTLCVVYSIAPEDSLAGNYVRNRWGIYYSYGIKVGGGSN